MSTVDDVKNRLDILDVVSQYEPLQRSGRSYKAVCPFHSEKTASFYVFPERQSWRCFGACATGGDIFAYVMRKENLQFGEALRRLAQQAGVALEETGGARRSERDRIYQVNEGAGEFFRRLLASKDRGTAAMVYLRDRGLAPDTIDAFGLGLSPGDGTSLMTYLASKGYSQEQMVLAGVATRGDDGRHRDLFRRRLMIPIRDAEGRLAGFGGRSLDGSQPKYLNSPRTPVFDKGNILYAMHLARDAKEGRLVIVEGYMDAIAAHQHGFSDVVASMGTALTQQQVDLVRRQLGRAGGSGPGPGEVVLALDPDAAGQEATLRSLESSWKVFQAPPRVSSQAGALFAKAEGPALKVASLPPGKDPDEIIMEDPGRWAELVGRAEPMLDYLFTALARRLDPGTPQGKSRLAELLFPLIAGVQDPFQQDHYFRRLADLLGVSEATLQASVGRLRQGSGGRARPGRRQREAGGPGAHKADVSPFATLGRDSLEEHCLGLILQNPQVAWEAQPAGSAVDSQGNGLRTLAMSLLPEYFRQPQNRELFTNSTKCSTLDVLRETLDDDLAGHLGYLLGKPLPPSTRKELEEDLGYCVRRLEERYLRDLNKEEELRLSQASPEEIEEQERKVVEVGERLRRLFTGGEPGPLREPYA